MPNADPAQAKQGEQGADEGADEKVTISSGELSQIVNSAVTAQLKRILAKELAPAVQAAMGPLKQELDALKPKEGEPQKPEGKKHPEMLALEQRLEQMQAALQKAEDEKATERKVAREDRAFSGLVSELTGKVRPGTEKMVATLLKADGRLLIDEESGNPLLRVRASRIKGMAEEDLDLPITDGLAHYLKTKDAQIFLPSPGNGGAGKEGGVSPAARQSAGGKAPTFDKPPATDEEAAARTLAQFEAMGIDPNVLNSLV
jgi:hypothetical protein